MLGYAFMGKAHANAYRTLSLHDLAAAAAAAAGRDRRSRPDGRRRSRATLRLRTTRVTDWRELVGDDRVQLFDNAGPEQPARRADDRGGRGRQARDLREAARHADADEAYEIWRARRAAGVKHMCAFNYRFVPAVRLARQMIEAGELG